MKKLFCSCVLFLFFMQNSMASIGNLTGSCWEVAAKKFPGAELIGMTGGRMFNFNVSGYLIDNENTPHKFFCYFPYSHGKPKRFVSEIFAGGEKDPVAFTRKVFTQKQKSFYESIEAEKKWRKEREEQRKELEKAIHEN